jgi:hypothetical protein
MQPAGNSWLREKFEISPINEHHESFIGGRRQTIEDADGKIKDIFTKNYWPGESALSHIEFSLKYDNLNLDLLEQVFRKIPTTEIEAYISAKPTSKFRKKIGFFYEFMLPRTLNVKVGGNFESLLAPKKYFTGTPLKSTKWRIKSNLLGSSGFCPIVRRTKSIDRKLKKDWPSKIQQIAEDAEPALLARAVNYIYLKETKASFDIENEKISQSKEERFVKALSQVGKEDMDSVLDEKRLTEIQNMIVDPRYANKAFRDSQNYVGETLPNYSERIHYVCPPPILVKTLMAGLRTFIKRSEELPPPLRAAVISFGFVYTHPFDDGNGRLHRLLLHESLAYDGYVDKRLVLPFSAVMLKDMASYDRVLESYASAVMQRVKYDLDNKGKLTIKNEKEASGIWRYPDFTHHVEYVIDMIEATVLNDLPNEIGLLQRWDIAREAASNVVDMPNGKLNLLMRLLYQNRGKLSVTKRKSEFPELTNKEIKAIEIEFKQAFNLK